MDWSWSDYRHGTLPHLGPNRCHSNRDGDCYWSDCPQLRDGEPRRSGRHCPLDEKDPDR